MKVICLKCKIGFLIQLVCENEDVVYCPICEEVFHDSVLWRDFNMVNTI